LPLNANPGVKIFGQQDLILNPRKGGAGSIFHQSAAPVLCPMKVEEIKKVGVVGAGFMGSGIAFNFALWGYPTILNDLTDQVLRQSIKNIKAALTMFVEEGLITRQQADKTVRRIYPTTDLAKVADESDFVTEAIIESLEAKRELFNKLDKLCPPHTIIASNTSVLMLRDFAADVKRQDKVVITHYFVPAHIVPGVEVVKGPGTSEETFKITCELMKKIRKVPIRVSRQLPGCLLNRIVSAMRREAYRLWADGVATAEDIDLGIRATFGFRLPYDGALMNYDLAGIWKWPKDVRLGWSRLLTDEFPLSAEEIDKIRQRIAEGTPWFIDPQKLTEENEKMNRKYLRNLKELYWSFKD